MKYSCVYWKKGRRSISCFITNKQNRKSEEKKTMKCNFSFPKILISLVMPMKEQHTVEFKSNYSLWKFCKSLSQWNPSLKNSKGANFYRNFTLMKTWRLWHFWYLRWICFLLVEDGVGKILFRRDLSRTPIDRLFQSPMESFTWGWRCLSLKERIYLWNGNESEVLLLMFIIEVKQTICIDWNEQDEQLIEVERIL